MFLLHPAYQVFSRLWWSEEDRRSFLSLRRCAIYGNGTDPAPASGDLRECGCVHQLSTSSRPASVKQTLLRSCSIQPRSVALWMPSRSRRSSYGVATTKGLCPRLRGRGFAQVPNEGLSRVGHEQFWSPLQMDRGRSNPSCGRRSCLLPQLLRRGSTTKELFNSSSSIGRHRRRHSRAGGHHLTPLEHRRFRS